MDSWTYAQIYKQKLFRKLNENIYRQKQNGKKPREKDKERERVRESE